MKLSGATKEIWKIQEALVLCTVKKIEIKSLWSTHIYFQLLNPLIMESIPVAAISELTFSVHDFEYTIKFHQPDDLLYIVATHNKEYLQWNANIGESLPKYAAENKNNNMEIHLTPKAIYNILKKFSEKKLEQSTEIIFPEKYKTSDTKMLIEIKITLPYDEQYLDINLVELMPCKIPDDQRLMQIMKSQHDQLNTKLNNENKRLQEAVVLVNKQLLTANEQFKQEIKRLSTENERLIERANKTDLSILSLEKKIGELREQLKKPTDDVKQVEPAQIKTK